GSRPGQKTDDAVIAEDQSGDDRCDDGKERRGNHFPKAGFCTDIDTFRVISFCLSFHKTGNLSKLTTYFHNDALCSPSHGFHGKSGKHEWKTGADKDTDKNGRVHDTHVKGNICAADFLYL